MNGLPDGVTRRGKTAEFTEHSMPDGLRNKHRTAAYTWGRIVILEGKLRYRVLEPEIRESELSPGKPGVIEPGVAHEVEPLGKVRFCIEFYR